MCVCHVHLKYLPGNFLNVLTLKKRPMSDLEFHCWTLCLGHIAHLQQQCHNSKSVIFQEKVSKVLKCNNFLWVQRRHNCSPAASFANCFMTIYLLKVHLQTFFSIPINKKIPNFELWLSCSKWAICNYVEHMGPWKMRDNFGWDPALDRLEDLNIDWDCRNTSAHKQLQHKNEDCP